MTSLVLRNQKLSLKVHIVVVIVAIDYFTKWVEAKPMRTVDQYDVITFIKDLMCRFGIPQSITVDNGTVFDSVLVREFLGEYGVSLIHSTPYYAQFNGQVKAVNKQIKKGIQKAIENNPREWHNILLDVLWAYRTSKSSSTGTTPYTLVYGYDAVLPIEIGVNSLRVKNQNDLTGCQYQQAMNMELEDIDEQRIRALNSI